jgi:chromosome transmission fidelity protein 1
MKAVQHRQDLEQRLARIREREEKVEKRLAKGEPLPKRTKIEHLGKQRQADEDEFVLDDYNSDSESVVHSTVTSSLDVSKETQAILKRLGMLSGSENDDDDAEMPDELKIFYCSRTHSQLSQFANELRRVRPPPVLDYDTLPEHERLQEELKQITLGSRKNLCINPKVNQLSSAIAINERCLELQQSKTAPEHRCDFLPNKENEPLVNTFRDRALAKIQDIEDLGQLGKTVGICPYYATRAAVRPSEVIADFLHFVKKTNSSVDCYPTIPTATSERCP